MYFLLLSNSCSVEFTDSQEAEPVCCVNQVRSVLNCHNIAGFVPWNFTPGLNFFAISKTCCRAVWTQEFPRRQTQLQSWQLRQNDRRRQDGEMIRLAVRFSIDNTSKRRDKSGFGSNAKSVSYCGDVTACDSIGGLWIGTLELFMAARKQQWLPRQFTTPFKYLNSLRQLRKQIVKLQSCLWNDVN